MSREALAQESQAAVDILMSCIHIPSHGLAVSRGERRMSAMAGIRECWGGLGSAGVGICGRRIMIKVSLE